MTELSEAIQNKTAKAAKVAVLMPASLAAAEASAPAKARPAKAPVPAPPAPRAAPRKFHAGSKHEGDLHEIERCVRNQHRKRGGKAVQARKPLQAQSQVAKGLGVKEAEACSVFLQRLAETL